jgi:hypothetical protein
MSKPAVTSAPRDKLGLKGKREFGFAASLRIPSQSSFELERSNAMKVKTNVKAGGEIPSTD